MLLIPLCFWIISPFWGPFALLLFTPVSPLSISSGLLHNSPDSLAESWFRAKLSRQRSYSSAYSCEESDLDLNRSLGIHALIDNMISFIHGDVSLTPAFKEPEESMSTSPQATILAMEQQQSRAEVSDWSSIFVQCYTILRYTTNKPNSSEVGTVCCK